MPTQTYHAVDILETLTSATNYNQYLLDQILVNKGENTFIVDFGAGIGTFALLLREKLIHVFCIETCNQSAMKLQKLDFKVFHNLSAFDDESIDFIYSFNVLEHIENDQAILNEISKKLKKGGKFLLYVPAFNILFSGLDRKAGHYRRYTKSSLIPLLEQSNFYIDNAFYVDSIGYIASLIIRITNYNQGDLKTKDVQFYDQFIFPLSLKLDKVLKYKFGKNLLVTCSKL